MRTRSTPDRKYWKWAASQLSVLAMGLTDSDQRQPGSSLPAYIAANIHRFRRPREIPHFVRMLRSSPAFPGLQSVALSYGTRNRASSRRKPWLVDHSSSELITAHG
jgi:hypothetical protein